MSVTVRQLNGDSTFLLICSPEADPTAADLRSGHGAYTILIDPWLVGSSVTTAPWFARTTRVEPSAIDHLSELDDEPDLVLCSQNKTDHTNKETLLQLPPEATTRIVAEPAAAKTIQSWNHFDPSRVQPLARYEARSKSDNVHRIRLPPLTVDGDAGEVTIAFIPAKNYITGLHNAFGITYQPPTRTRSAAPVSKIHVTTTGQATTPGSASQLPDQFSQQPPFRSVVTPPEEQDTGINQQNLSSEFSFFELSEHVKPEPLSVGCDLPTPPLSPYLDSSARSSMSTASSSQPSLISHGGQSANASQQSAASESSKILSNRSKAISIIYSPHGIPYADLLPYVRNHLLRIPGALPLSLLFHSFDHASNPWYLGGNIMTGAEGGMQIAQALMAKCWISAHDEEKDDRGLATKMLKMKRNRLGDVRELFHASNDANGDSWQCDITSLDVGASITVAQGTKSRLRGIAGAGPNLVAIPVAPVG